MSRLAFGIVLACLLGVALPTPAQQQASLALTPNESATAFSRQTGRRLVFVCPPIDTPSKSIWGIDVYADDSAICTAALQSGKLRLGEAGLVAILMGGETGPFRGDSRNGVTSASYANSDFSYTLTADTTPAAIEWTTTALRMPKGFSQPVTVLCPAGGNPDAAIWGKDTYISDSAICVAAVHAGVITFEGGAVTVTKVPGVDSYIGERQHGVTSMAWSAWADAFTVTAGSANGGMDASDTRRRIRLAGFTGVGEGDEGGKGGEGDAARTRKISLNGYTGVGAGADVKGADGAARRITLRGWAGTGTAP